MTKRSLQNLAFAVAAGGIAVVLALFSVKIWNASLDIPFEYYWDSLATEAQIKGLLDNGSLFTNEDLGAPFGQELVDYHPGGATTYLFAMFLGLFTNSWATATNLVWLAGFAAVGTTAWLVMHSLGVPRLPALICAVLFAILPYHFWRGEAHLTISGYFAVPLAGWLVLNVLRGDPLFLGPRSEASASKKIRRAGLVAAICFLIGIGAVYYSVFTLLLLGAASVLALLIRERRTAGISGILATGLIGLSALVSFAPVLAFKAENGANPEAGVRTARESESLGLSLAQLVLPATNHRMDELADAKQEFLSQTIAPSEDAQSLGLLGTIGLVVCLLSVLLLPIGRPAWIEPLLSSSGVSILLAFLLGTIGGGRNPDRSGRINPDKGVEPIIDLHWLLCPSWVCPHPRPSVLFT